MEDEFAVNILVENYGECSNHFQKKLRSGYWQIQKKR